MIGSHDSDSLEQPRTNQFQWYLFKNHTRIAKHNSNGYTETAKRKSTAALQALREEPRAVTLNLRQLTSVQRNHETNTKVHPLLRHTPTAPDKIVATGNMSIEYRRFVDRRCVLPIRVFQQLASKYRGHVSELEDTAVLIIFVESC